MLPHYRRKSTSELSRPVVRCEQRSVFPFMCNANGNVFRPKETHDVTATVIAFVLERNMAMSKATDRMKILGRNVQCCVFDE
jgi:hypothetical protein